MCLSQNTFNYSCIILAIKLFITEQYVYRYRNIFFQLLDTLPVCQDFNRQLCNRPACKFIHLYDGNVEVVDNRVTVCRDAVKGACMRPQCKYYHIPVALPPAPLMAISASSSS
ncbi:hypothetical protein KQX54_021021 [Cotesia glomerata]|uniref:C3H1-type domain-containing protein n=1 Tax=Cotesia glomerata TaxID=32391 RepID=A0AAV7IV71_COTGL|nr:hypothetical protein KQX54_021021 [Cotesia glomerata]